jgi:hypothetical protein
VNSRFFHTFEEKAMYLPMQSEPVQRTVAGQPSAERDQAAAKEAGGQGVAASEFGIQPSGFDWGSLIGPALGALTSIV